MIHTKNKVVHLIRLSNEEDIDYKKINTIDELHMYFDIDENGNIVMFLRIIFLYSTNNVNHKLEILFKNVSNLSLNSLNPPYIQIMGFEILVNNYESMAQNSKYEIRDYEDNRIYFNCQDIEILSIYWVWCVKIYGIWGIKIHNNY